MSKFSFGLWYECDMPACYVASKSKYSKEEFRNECEHDADGYYKFGEIKEKHARYFPVAPEGVDIDGGCYSFCNPGRGSFPVWCVDIEPI